MKMTDKVMEKARSAENSAALLALAKENGMDMTQEEAEGLFERMHRKGELSDQELENVTGGCGGSSKPKFQPTMVSHRETTCRYWECTYCHSKQGVRKYNYGLNKYELRCCGCHILKVCESCIYCEMGDYQGALELLCYCKEPMNLG